MLAFSFIRFYYQIPTLNAASSFQSRRVDGSFKVDFCCKFLTVGLGLKRQKMIVSFGVAYCVSYSTFIIGLYNVIQLYH